MVQPLGSTHWGPGLNPATAVLTISALTGFVCAPSSGDYLGGEVVITEPPKLLAGC